MKISTLVYGPFADIIHQLQQLAGAQFNVSPESILVEEPANVAFGHLSIALRQLLNKTERQLGGGHTLINQRVSEMKPVIMGWPEVEAVTEVNGFLNIRLKDTAIATLVTEAVLGQEAYGTTQVGKGQHDVVEYVSPNTNKPLHLGHVRNMTLGMAVIRLLEATGVKVTATCVVNDRGPHIAKSMIAYARWGNGSTPESTGQKGDHFVGNWYVRFNTEYQAQRATQAAAAGLDLAGIEARLASIKQAQKDKGLSVEQRQQLFGEAAKLKEQLKAFEAELPLNREVREVVRKWEADDPETRALWELMNGWVYQGFAETYALFGVTFSTVFYESQIYLLGKELVTDGLARGIFERDESGAVVYPYRRVERSGKETVRPTVMLKSDGTSLYHTQDLALASKKAEMFSPDHSIYVVGNEQDEHFIVLFEILERFGFPWAAPGRLHHLSYGMVELPEGKMKSRTGTVVDADDLVAGLAEMAKTAIQSRQKEDEKLDEQELALRAQTVAQAALRYYLLKYPAKTKITYNPEASLSFEGDSGPYLLYVVARIHGILRKVDGAGGKGANPELLTTPEEMSLLLQLAQFPGIVVQSAAVHDPSGLAMYLRDLAQGFSTWYQNHPVLQAEPAVSAARVKLLNAVLIVMTRGLELLGIIPLTRM